MTLRRLSDAERRDWLRLVRTPNIGPQTFARLIERFGNATDALAALPDIANRVAKGRRIEVPSPASIEDEIAATLRLGARIIASCEPDFPKLLVSLDPPPPVLTVLASWSWRGQTRWRLSGRAMHRRRGGRWRGTWRPTLGGRDW